MSTSTTIPPGAAGDNGSDYKLIVIGASAGGMEAIKELVTALPPDFYTPLFVVWHMAPTIQGIMPQILNKVNNIYAAHAYDGELIRPNRIYVAPPDYHLLIERGTLSVRHGPKENRFRPAVDPLFRSAAHVYGPRVIGIILSGALDDGTAGLWSVKHNGGTAIVQDPRDAQIPDMPRNAMREVQVDYAVPVANLAPLLVELTEQQADKIDFMALEEDKNTRIEIKVASEKPPAVEDVMKLGELTPYTCPECHGVLMRLKEGNYIRFRCHTGHAYSSDSLLLSLMENIEESLYNAMRGIEETVLLFNHIGDHLAENNQARAAGLYFKKARESEYRAGIIRQALATGETLVASEDAAEKVAPSPNKA